MASLLLPAPNTCSAASSLFSRSAFTNPTARFFAPNAVRCEMNGQSRRLENARIKIISDTANHEFSQEIASYMGGEILIKRFVEGESCVDELQESVRGCDVYLVQPTCSPPSFLNIISLKIMIDACRRVSAKNITAVIPYYGYAKEFVAAKLAADLLPKAVAGADRVLACDLHDFFIPTSVNVDHVYCQSVILDYLASKKICSADLVVVSLSPHHVGGVERVGGFERVERARAFANNLSDAPLAILDINVAEVMNLIGDVKGKIAVMVDDIIDTAGTMYKGAELLHEAGAREVYACCTHAVFSPPAIERLSSGLFQEVIVTNTIPVQEKNYFPQLTLLSVANLLGETMWRVHRDNDCSVSGILQ